MKASSCDDIAENSVLPHLRQTANIPSFKNSKLPQLRTAPSKIRRASKLKLISPHFTHVLTTGTTFQSPVNFQNPQNTKALRSAEKKKKKEHQRFAVCSAVGFCGSGNR